MAKLMTGALLDFRSLLMLITADDFTLPSIYLDTAIGVRKYINAFIKHFITLMDVCVSHAHTLRSLRKCALQRTC